MHLASLAFLLTSCLGSQYRREDLPPSSDLAALKNTLLEALAPPVDIIWIGDSTTLGQMELLCDILTDRVDDPSSGDCEGGGVRVVTGENFGGAQRAWRMAPESATAYLDAAGGAADARRIVYFGSTLLHAMQLLPSRAYGGWPELNVTRGLGDVAAAVRSRRACPVFHTVNWICDAAFVDRYARVVRSATSYAAFSPGGRNKRSLYFESTCAATLGPERGRESRSARGSRSHPGAPTSPRPSSGPRSAPRAASTSSTRTRLRSGAATRRRTGATTRRASRPCSPRSPAPSRRVHPLRRS